MGKKAQRPGRSGSRTLCTSPQLGRLVDEYRLKATDQITGKLLGHSAEAIDEVFAALTRGRNHAAKFAAVRIILDNALRFWVRFDQTKTMHDLKAKVATMMQKRSSPSFGGSPYPSATGAGPSPWPTPPGSGGAY